MDSGQDRDGLLGDIDTREDSCGLGDTGETFVQNLRRQVAELEVDVILLGTDTTTFTDLNCHRTGHDVTGGKILRGRRITLHEPLTLRVEEVSSLTART